MKLFVSSTSVFVRKVRVVVRERGLVERVEEISRIPVEAAPDLVAANPLSQLPALIDDEGICWTDSGLISAWLDTQGEGPRLIPDYGTDDYWQVKRVETAAAALNEMMAKIVYENRRPENERSPFWLARWESSLKRAFAVAEVGEDQADNLIEIWSALGDARRNLAVLDFGGMLRFGHVLNRWVTRPMVPYPLELTDAEKRDYRPFLFQAKGEAEAADLVDIQAMRMYEGWGARLLFERASELSEARAERARRLFAEVAAAAPTPEARAYWDLTARRTQALVLLLRSAEDMVKYQAQLDRVKALGVKPEENPVLGVQPDWARADMVNLARREIDTAVALRKLITDSKDPILDLAPNPAEETIMRLGPNVPDALARKVRTMGEHWRDYDRLFTVPNP